MERVHGESARGRTRDSSVTSCTASTTATTVRVVDGETQITDGPFAVTKELLAGYYIIDCPDLDAALGHAARAPIVDPRIGRGAAGLRLPGGLEARRGSRREPGRRGGGRSRRSGRRRRARVPRGARRRAGALIRQVGDFQLAEDAVQDAFAAAVATWPRDGVPANPAAWITTAARRRAIDRLRRTRSLADRTDRLGELARLDSQEHAGSVDESAVVRRSPAADLHVLSPGARPFGEDGAHAEDAGRPHDRRDRAGVPRLASRRWASASRGRRRRSRRRDPLPGAERRRRCPTGFAASWPSCT